MKKQIKEALKFRLPFAPGWYASSDTDLLLETIMDQLLSDPPPQRWDNVLHAGDEADKARKEHSKEGGANDDDDDDDD